ncbi:hypothetical protein V1290_000069 [Bradyrhizobium sp. AZCC 1578]|uniref:hypothetical protein n=1 Tax=Bradyrhizobium sp. AZCC 1578 TaxID=3117027 RepID=UPI002FF12EE7
MIDFRAGIIAVTICALVAIAANRPQPVKDNQVPYCVIVEKAAQRDRFGNWHVGWGQGYGPCSLQDIYREI